MTCAQWMDLASLFSFFVWSSAALTVQGAPSHLSLTALPLPPCPASPEHRELAPLPRRNSGPRSG